MMRLNIVSKIIVFIFLMGLVVLLQYQYDATRITLPASSNSGLSPLFVRALDMGFHPAVASFSWATTMPEVLDLFAGKTEYFNDLANVNQIDPKLSFPYAFSSLILPAVTGPEYAEALKESYIIGQEGIQNADPDWRTPYYMATNYFLWSKDNVDAAKYYDIAAHTPGIPAYAARFALNFGIENNQRQKTEQLWETIRDSTNDQSTKDRAQAYIDRLQDFDYLEAAVAQYKKVVGAYPTSTAELLQKNIIPEVPQDPFGFTFAIYPDGTVGIDQNSLPAYLQSAPKQ
jgi:hypothetical protein